MMSQLHANNAANTLLHSAMDAVGLSINHKAT